MHRQRRILLSKLEVKKEAVHNITLGHQGEKILVLSESINSIEGLKKYLLERRVKAVQKMRMITRLREGKIVTLPYSVYLWEC
ncbi:MAG: hypothetical protein LZ167_02220 [Thaumarchaeota archaeon]|jgi:malate/lactate dehydrogenase|nr:hypothetical protein [Candidatus Geocrenenecus arthurdayi]MCL7388781.1 hypothetical protein [Candidatus Geocrenenecus arthurdayi]MCL7396216.1 hypothetical protein [Candidatus Geocrenenecus arthurdayi]